MLGLLGMDGVALGSDFDSALLPEAVGTAAGLPALVGAMADHGYDDSLLHKLCHGNWLRVLESGWA